MGFLDSFVIVLVTVSSILNSVVCHPLPERATKPVAFFLAGDSTTATQSANGGGWGDGFLNTTLKNGAIGTNYGHNGRTTKTFRSGGDWANVLSAVSEHTSVYTPYVTIQFGHNDQKPENNVTVPEFIANLKQFVTDVRSAGGTAILITPLTRRSYSNGAIIQDLDDMRNATIIAAQAMKTDYIDLNRASTAYLDSVGQTDAWTYNLNPDDRTHLNVVGSVVFGNMVSWLIGGLVADGKMLGMYTMPDETMVKDFESGTYFYPSV